MASIHVFGELYKILFSGVALFLAPMTAETGKPGKSFSSLPPPPSTPLPPPPKKGHCLGKKKETVNPI